MPERSSDDTAAVCRLGFIVFGGWRRVELVTAGRAHLHPRGRAAERRSAAGTCHVRALSLLASTAQMQRRVAGEIVILRGSRAVGEVLLTSGAAAAHSVWAAREASEKRERERERVERAVASCSSSRLPPWGAWEAVWVGTECGCPCLPASARQWRVEGLGREEGGGEECEEGEGHGRRERAGVGGRVREGGRGPLIFGRVFEGCRGVAEGSGCWGEHRGAPQ
eukprot:scaffold256463_cov28-Tisochrysis_lutea.AAC.1